jgi:hypothetical protein
LIQLSVIPSLRYEDVNDAEWLSQDPTFRLIGSEKIWERGAALTSRLQSFETELLTQEGNLTGLASINRELILRLYRCRADRGDGGQANRSKEAGGRRGV